MGLFDFSNKQNTEKNNVSSENELANNATISTTSETKKSTTIHTAQKESSKLEVYETTLLKQEEVVTINEIKKESNSCDLQSC